MKKISPQKNNVIEFNSFFCRKKVRETAFSINKLHGLVEILLIEREQKQHAREELLIEQQIIDDIINELNIGYTEQNCEKIAYSRTKHDKGISRAQEAFAVLDDARISQLAYIISHALQALKKELQDAHNAQTSHSLLANISSLLLDYKEKLAYNLKILDLQITQISKHLPYYAQELKKAINHAKHDPHFPRARLQMYYKEFEQLLRKIDLSE